MTSDRFSGIVAHAVNRIHIAYCKGIHQMQGRHLSALTAASLFISSCSFEAGSQASAPSTIGAPEIAAAEWDAHFMKMEAAEKIPDRVERCLAFPDLPGNRWFPGSAQARCRLLAEQQLALGDIADAFAAPGGEKKLEARYSDLLDSHYSDPSHLGILFRVFPFDASDEARSAAEHWAAKSPDSAFALTALARQRLATAWEARGDNYVGEISPRRIATMHRLLEQALLLFEKALAIEPRVVPACMGMIDVGMLTGDDAVKQRGIAACDRTDPNAWQVMRLRMTAAQPKWGGSKKEVAELVEIARGRMKENPALGGFLAKATALDADPLVHAQGWAEAMPVLKEIIRTAPDPLYIGYAGQAAKHLGDPKKALIYMSQALRLAPDDTYLLGLRASLRFDLGDHAGAAMDAERAIALDDSSAYRHALLGRAKQALGDREAASREYEIAMRDQGQRRWAFEKWCELKIVPQVIVDDALACTAGLVNEYPNEPKALFMRAWALSEAGDPEAARVAERFYGVADPNKQFHASMVSQLRARLGTR